MDSVHGIGNDWPCVNSEMEATHFANVPSMFGIVWKMVLSTPVRRITHYGNDVLPLLPGNCHPFKIRIAHLFSRINANLINYSPWRNHS